MPQPIEKYNRVVKAITAGKKKNGATQSARDIEAARTDWKITWMNVYDECRREMATLRSDNVRLFTLLDDERKKKKDVSDQLNVQELATLRSDNVRLLALVDDERKNKTDICDQLKIVQQGSDKKTKIIDRLKRELAVYTDKVSIDASTQYESSLVDAATQSEVIMNLFIYLRNQLRNGEQRYSKMNLKKKNISVFRS